MGYSNLHKLVGAAGLAGGAGGATVSGSGAGAGYTNPYFNKLVAEKLDEWEWMTRFIEMNPDLKERWEQHKTYEILKNEQLSDR